MVFLYFSIFAAILAIYLVILQNKLAMNSKAGDKMVVHALVWFWTSFQFLIYFAIDNGDLNLFWILGILVYLLFNIYITRLAVNPVDLPIYVDTFWYRVIVAFWFFYLISIFGFIANAQLNLLFMFTLFAYLLVNIALTRLVFEPKDLFEK